MYEDNNQCVLTFGYVNFRSDTRGSTVFQNIYLLFIYYYYFFSDFQTLKPIFLVYGINGCGKELLIESVSKYLGIQYISQCCFHWPTNNIAQFKKRIECFFDDVRKITPCLLHLENIEVSIIFFKKFSFLK